MQDLLTMIATRHRPPLLVRAARHGIDDYNRTARLPRLLNRPAAPRVGEAIVALLDLETEMEERRVARAADYAIARHVDVLTALMGEARLLRTGLAEGRAGGRDMPATPPVAVFRPAPGGEIPHPGTVERKSLFRIVR